MNCKQNITSLSLLVDTTVHIAWIHQTYNNTVKPVLSGHLKIDKTKVLMDYGSLMKEVLQNAPIGAFCNTFDLH